MGITASSYTLFPDTISCSGEVEGILSLSAGPDIVSNPADIVMVLDCSGSMEGEPFAAMKASVKTFIDIIDESTDENQDGNIGGGSQIAIVSFARTATQQTGFLTNTADLKTAVNNLTIDGGTNHEDAFTKAYSLFDPDTTHQKIMVMFTDGQSTAGGSAVPITTLAKENGVVIYCVVLKGLFGTDVPAASLWVSSPATSFLSIAPTTAELEEIFSELAANISNPGATEILMQGLVADDFILTELLPPDKGTAQQLDAHSFRWSIAKLGVTAIEGASLRFRLKHIATTSGEKAPMKEILYSDAENNVVIFPVRKVFTDCTEEIDVTPCPPVVTFTMDDCQDFLEYDLGNFIWENAGRILECSLTLRQICPNRSTALALILTEINDEGESHPRGFQTFTIPAHHANGCRDILVKSIRFVLPEDSDTACRSCRLCKKRRFKMQVIAHAIESNFVCNAK